MSSCWPSEFGSFARLLGRNFRQKIVTKKPKISFESLIWEIFIKIGLIMNKTYKMGITFFKNIDFRLYKDKYVFISNS